MNCSWPDLDVDQPVLAVVAVLQSRNDGGGWRILRELQQASEAVSNLRNQQGDMAGNKYLVLTSFEAF